MGRIIAFVLALSLLLCACSASDPSYSKPIEFFYPLQTPDYSIGSVYILAETREGHGLGDDLTTIINAYLKGPLDKNTFANPFRSNTYVHAISIVGEVLEITLSSTFATLRGLDLTKACACLTMTCLKICDVKTVRIRADGVSLDGAPFIEMNEDSILLLDNSGTKE